MEYLDNPCSSARKPNVKNQKERWLLPGEYERLLEHREGGIRLIFQFAVETAMRRSEIMGLNA